MTGTADVIELPMTKCDEHQWRSLVSDGQEPISATRCPDLVAHPCPLGWALSCGVRRTCTRCPHTRRRCVHLAPLHAPAPPAPTRLRSTEAEGTVSTHTLHLTPSHVRRRRCMGNAKSPVAKRTTIARLGVSHQPCSAVLCCKCISLSPTCTLSHDKAVTILVPGTRGPLRLIIAAAERLARDEAANA